jgi:salicylate hydroxylase
VRNYADEQRIGDMRHVMTYTISPANGETLCGNTFNMVLSHPEDSKPSTWKQETAVADMQQQFKDWDFR